MNLVIKLCFHLSQALMMLSDDYEHKECILVLPLKFPPEEWAFHDQSASNTYSSAETPENRTDDENSLPT